MAVSRDFWGYAKQLKRRKEQLEVEGARDDDLV